MLDPRFVAPVTDAIQDIYEESQCRKPVLYLLTAGSDPTFSIDELAKKKKKYPTDKVSMGEGQERVARDPRMDLMALDAACEEMMLKSCRLRTRTTQPSSRVAGLSSRTLIWASVAWLAQSSTVLIKHTEGDQTVYGTRCFYMLPAMSFLSK